MKIRRGRGKGIGFMQILTPTPSGSTNDPIVTITGRTTRKGGVDAGKPVITIMGNVVPDGNVTPNPSDPYTVFDFTYDLALAEGENTVVVGSDGGARQVFAYTRLTVVASCDITIQKNQSGSYLANQYLPAGNHNVKITSTFDLTQVPTLAASLGSLGALSGTGKVWTAVLTITGGENGSGTFSNAVLVNAAGTGTVINTGASYTVDTTAPTIVSGLFSMTVWHSPDGSLTLTVAMGESTVGWTGQVDLSAFGQSGSAALSPSGNNMVRTFTPTKQDAGPVAAANIRVFDRAGNAATNNGMVSGNTLQTIQYSIAPETLGFLAGEDISAVLSGGKSFTNPAWVEVEWAPSWPRYGEALTDYTIINNNAIQLGATYTSDVEANLGTMAVVVSED